MTKNRLLLLAGFLATAFALPASAQLYIGGSLGRSHFVDVCTGNPGPCKDRDTEFGLFAGYQLGRYLGLEGGYRDFGHVQVLGIDVKGNAFEASAVGSLPLRGGFSVLGRIGGYSGKLRGSGVEEKTRGATYGLGGQYDFSPNTAMRLEWQRYRGLGGGDFGAKTDVDSYSLGLVMRFD